MITPHNFFLVVVRVAVIALVTLMSLSFFRIELYLTTYALILLAIGSLIIEQRRGVSYKKVDVFLSRKKVPVVLILVIALVIGVHGWNIQKAGIRYADELCGIRQASAFGQFSATLPLNTFGKYVDPTGACFTKSQQGFFSIQAPGWPVGLAFLKAFGIPENSVSWVISTLILAILGLIGFELGNVMLGLALMLMYRNNQFFDQMSASYWSHSLSALFLAGGFWASLTLLKIQSSRKESILLLVTGICAGGLIITRPLPGMGFVAYLLLWRVIVYIEHKQFQLKQVLVDGALLLIGPIIAFLLYGWFNFATTGSFFLSGYEYLYGAGHNPGLYQKSPNGVVFTPLRAYLVLTHHVNTLLPFVVPSQGCFFTILALSLGVLWSRETLRMLLLLICLWGALATYWDSSYFYGPRFYYESMIPLFVFIVWSLYKITELAASFITHEVLRKVFFVVSFISLVIIFWPGQPIT